MRFVRSQWMKALGRHERDARLRPVVALGSRKLLPRPWHGSRGLVEHADGRGIVWRMPPPPWKTCASLALTIACCGPTSRASEPPSATTATPRSLAAASALPKTCDETLGVPDNVRTAIDCAHDRFEAGAYDAADAIAEVVMTKFPYTAASIEAEEMRIDILLVRQQFEAAEAACDRFLKAHPSNARVDAIRKKQRDAHARLAP